MHHLEEHPTIISVGRVSARHRLRSPWLWLIAALVGAALLSSTQGLTNWWDIVNYHIYNPWALLHHREGVDLFPAGIQGYFDPLLDVPYYFLAFKWLPNHPRIVAALTGLPFGFLVFVTLLLTRRVLHGLAGHKPTIRAAVILVIALMALSGTSTWSQAFTITGEVPVAVLGLGAVLLLIEPLGDDPTKRLGGWQALAIGALLGAAAGLKLTAVIYAPAGGLLVLATSPNWRSALRNGVTFFIGWLALFAALYGPWGMHLYASTGNPIFPMFNDVFHSPLAAAGSTGRDTRFLPQSALQWFFYPFYWLNDRAQTVFPLKFQDARFALAYALGILAALTALAKRLYYGNRSRYVLPRPLLVLLAFWFIAYATWLPMFSLLRYAVVLEVSGCIVAAAALLFLAQQWLPRLRLPDAARVALMVVLVFGTMRFARIPDLGRIPARAPTFEAQVPKLGTRPLVILANQPMGLLAPLIQRTNNGATFIGIPACFARGQWCFNGFYGHGLGRRMRQKIIAHNGPMYVARYLDRIPALPQLHSFHIAINKDSPCQIMRTNRTPDVALCPASYQPMAAMTAQRAPQFRLDVQIQMLEPGFRLTSRWLHNTCSDAAQLGQLGFAWHAPAGVGEVRAFVVSPPSKNRTLFAAASRDAQVQTDRWVRSGQTFVFTNSAGDVLAKSSIRYVSCGKGEQESAHDHKPEPSQSQAGPDVS